MQPNFPSTNGGRISFEKRCEFPDRHPRCSSSLANPDAEAHRCLSPVESKESNRGCQMPEGRLTAIRLPCAVGGNWHSNLSRRLSLLQTARPTLLAEGCAESSRRDFHALVVALWRPHGRKGQMTKRHRRSGDAVLLRKCAPVLSSVPSGVARGRSPFGTEPHDGNRRPPEWPPPHRCPSVPASC